MRPSCRTIYLFILSFLFVSTYAIDVQREFKVINASDGLADNSVQLLTCTKTGRLVISTKGGLNFYDGASFTHIDTKQDCQYPIPAYLGKYKIGFDLYHHLWLKDEGILACVDLINEQFVEDVGAVFREQFDCKDKVLDFFIDKENEVWLLTEKGLYRTKDKKTYQVMLDRRLLEVDIHGDLLMMIYDNGEEVGLEIMSGKVLHRTKAYEWDDAQKYQGNSVLLPYGNGYFQIRNGENGSVLLFFDIKNLEWTKLMALDYQMNDLAEQNECLYIASDYGYWIYNIHTGEKRHVEKLKLKGSDKSMNTKCNSISFDRQGGMWFATEKRGLLYSGPFALPFKVYDLDDPLGREYVSKIDTQEGYVGEFKGMQTNFILKDSRGWTWFGTTMGLYMYKTPQSKPVVFTRRTGLLNNIIHSIVEDKDHNIWVGTSYGISCVLFEGSNIVLVNSFNVEDNVPNESFVNCRAKCLDDGTIVMQGIDHVVVFHPDDFKEMNKRKVAFFYPKLIRLLVNGNYVEPREEIDGNVILDKAISRVKDISLNSNQNSITLTFSALNFFRPLQTYYRVKIKGLDDEWKVYSFYNSGGMVDKQGKLHLPLIGLRPGEYVVSIQVSLFPDMWPDEKPFQWIVHVNQPWWRTRGVLMLLIFVLLILMGVNLFFYNRNTKMRVRRNNEEGDMIRKICSFVDRCTSFSNEELRPNEDELNGSVQDSRNQMSPQFIELMEKLVPYIQKNDKTDLTINRLSKAGGIDIVSLYDITTGNLYKNPRELTRIMRLRKGAQLLRETNLSIDEIASQCKFYTTNYFIGNFFHEYKVTPQEYREDHH